MYIPFSPNSLIFSKAWRKPTLQWFSSVRHKSMHGPAHWSPTSVSSLWCSMCISFCRNYRIQSSFLCQCTRVPSWSGEEPLWAIEQLYPEPARLDTLLQRRCIPKCGYQGMPSKPEKVQLLSSVKLLQPYLSDLQATGNVRALLCECTSLPIPRQK